MKREEYIESKVGRETPFQVPENYFDEFIADVESKLPPYPDVPKPVPLSRWHRIRPYVYLAAMFCGIWCMMKIFHTATQFGSPLETPSEHIAMVMESPAEYGINLDSDSQDDFELEMEVADSYDSAEELHADIFDLDY